jgi:Protein of unknown function (DUF1254)
MVLSVPNVEKSRYYSVMLCDGNTFNYGYIGSRATGSEAGDYMVVGPNWQGATPPGIKKVFQSSTQFSVAASCVNCWIAWVTSPLSKEASTGIRIPVIARPSASPQQAGHSAGGARRRRSRHGVVKAALQAGPLARAQGRLSGDVERIRLRHSRRLHRLRADESGKRLRQHAVDRLNILSGEIVQLARDGFADDDAHVRLAGGCKACTVVALPLGCGGG